MPIHINTGHISRIEGENEVKKLDESEAVVRVHHLGDEIRETGTANQVFCYLHIKYNSIPELKKSISVIKDTLKVFDEHENQMLFYLINDDEF